MGLGHAFKKVMDRSHQLTLQQHKPHRRNNIAWKKHWSISNLSIDQTIQMWNQTRNIDDLGSVFGRKEKLKC